MLNGKFQLAVVEYLLLRTLERLPQVVIDEQGAAQNAYDLDHGSVQMQVVLEDFVFRLPFLSCDEELADLVDSEKPRTVFGSVAKMQISNPGQGVVYLNNCA